MITPGHLAGLQHTQGGASIQFSQVNGDQTRKITVQLQLQFGLVGVVLQIVSVFWRNIQAVSALACDCCVTTTAWDERNPLKKECHWGCSPLCKDPPGVMHKFIGMLSRVFHTRVWVAQFARQRKEARSSVRKITLVCSKFRNCTTHNNILYYAKGFSDETNQDHCVTEQAKKKNFDFYFSLWKYVLINPGQTGKQSSDEGHVVRLKAPSQRGNKHQCKTFVLNLCLPNLTLISMVCSAISLAQFVQFLHKQK